MRSHSGALGALAEGGGCSASCRRSSPAAAAGGETVRGCRRGPWSAAQPAAQHFVQNQFSKPSVATHVDAHLRSLHSSMCACHTAMACSEGI